VSAAGWLTLAVVCGFVWGGFATLLLRALRRERHKRDGGGA